MALIITPEIIKDIAGSLECGMVCFYNTKTHEVESYPDRNSYSTFDDGEWQDVFDKIDEHFGDYVKFNVLESHESFSIMENFISEIPDQKIQQKFDNAIHPRKPFQQFKNLIHYYPELLEKWYAFKTQALIEYVNGIVEEHNANEDEEE